MTLVPIKYTACPTTGCDGGAYIYPNSDQGQKAVAMMRELGGPTMPVFVFGDPQAKCWACGAALPMPFATEEQMDTDRSPLYQKLKEWGLEVDGPEGQP